MQMYEQRHDGATETHGNGYRWTKSICEEEQKQNRSCCRTRAHRKNKGSTLTRFVAQTEIVATGI
jgi:hypothetical protein